MALELGGKARHLRYTLGALKRIEDMAGMSISSPAFGEWASSMRGLSVLLWAGLLHENPDLTQDQVDDMVEMRDMSRVGEAIRITMEADTAGAPSPNGSAGPANPTPKAVTSIGARSGP